MNSKANFANAREILNTRMRLKSFEEEKKKEKIFLLLTYSIKGDTIKLYISIAFYLSIIIER